MYVCIVLQTVAEENYLKAIYSLTKAVGVEYAGTNQLSAKLGIRAASITDMLQRLSEKKLIDYKKYHGVKLSRKGVVAAVKIIRKHRLWEVFLVEKLGFTWDEVHEVAEQLEHINSDKLIEKLDSFLDHPLYDPHGDPIPDAKGRFNQLRQVELSKCKAGGELIFSGVKIHSSEFLQYISSLGFKLGERFFLMAVNTYDGLAEIKFYGNGESKFLGLKTTSNILVQAL